MIFRRKFKNDDFDLKNLPGTRRRQFLDFLKHDKSTLIKLGFIYLLFLLPFFAIYTLKFTFVSSISASQPDNASLIICYNNLFFNGLSIICYMMFFLGVYSSFNVIKNLCWNEGVLFWSDFFKGMKTNFKRALLFGFIFGLFLFIPKTAFDFGFVLNNRIGQVLFYLSILFILFFIFPIMLYLIIQDVLYKNKIKMNLSNALTILPDKYYVTLLFAFGCLIFLSSAFLCSNILIFVIIMVIVSLFLLPLFFVSWHLFVLSMFDKYMHDDSSGLKNKGLYL